MTIIVQNYVESMIQKHPYWNRTLGADHFFVTCHDVGVRAAEGLPLLVKNSICIVCSPSYDVGYIPHKDVALPQVLQPFALPAGGNDTENRSEKIALFNYSHLCCFASIKYFHLNSKYWNISDFFKFFESFYYIHSFEHMLGYLS